MELIHSHTSVTVRRTVNIIGGPVVDMAYSHPPKQFRVESVIIAYELNAAGVWVWDKWGTTASGTVLRKDGTDSKNKHRRDYYEGLPPWLKRIAEGLLPVGCVDLPFVAEIPGLGESLAT